MTVGVGSLAQAFASPGVPLPPVPLAPGLQLTPLVGDLLRVAFTGFQSSPKTRCLLAPMACLLSWVAAKYFTDETGFAILKDVAYTSGILTPRDRIDMVWVEELWEHDDRVIALISHGSYESNVTQNPHGHPFRRGQL